MIDGRRPPAISIIGSCYLLVAGHLVQGAHDLLDRAVLLKIGASYLADRQRRGGGARCAVHLPRQRFAAHEGPSASSVLPRTFRRRLSVARPGAATGEHVWPILLAGP